MKLWKPPFAAKLENAERILIAGAGGGFDVFSGLPLYFSLLSQGKVVYLANLSFTNLQAFEGDWVTSAMMRVTPQTKGIDGAYFPEWYLSKWFEQNGQADISIFAFARTGVLPLIHNYQTLIQDLQLDTIVLVDGGTDSLMCGDEDGLGTPSEDLASLAAVFPLDVPQKILMCLGFGVDHYHGVSNDLSFAAIAELTKANSFLGSTSLLNNMPEWQKYRQAAEYVFAAMPENISIVSSSILSALDGDYGDHHATERTKDSKLWINPLMAICWFFDLDEVAKRNMIIEHLYTTEFFDQVVRAVTIFRRLHLKETRNRETLPN